MKPAEPAQDDWQARLAPERYAVLRQAATEPAFSGALLHNAEKGTYSCAACGAGLFDSSKKYDSGSGWPSFTDPANRENVRLVVDDSHGMQRTEVRCARCDSHLGHVFDDGPGENGQRYCINSLALEFAKQQAG